MKRVDPSGHSASQIVHAYVGAPKHEDCARAGSPFVCWLCAGIAERGTPVDDFVGKSMTDQNSARAPNSTHVCEPCVYVRARFSPVPGRPPAEGKDQGGRFCNYSHLYDDAARAPYVNASKGEKPVTLAFLRAPHVGTWFAAIADSGQKHVLPYVPVNPPGARGRVRFEEATIALPDAAGWRIVDDMTALLTAGATKDELGRGDYTSRAWQLCGALVRAFEQEHGRQRGGDFFRLALWLAQRDEDAVAERMAAEKEAKRGEVKRGRAGAAPNPDRRSAPRGAPCVPGDGGLQPAQALGPAPVPHASGGKDLRKPRGVGDEARPQSAAAGPQQLGLPGLG